MLDMASIKKNLAYNVVYQILTMILPFITAPYIARVIGVEGTGVYSYTLSIVQYFVLFSMLGINNYGSRMISKVRDKKEETSKKFFEIYTIQIMMSIICIAIYFIYVTFFIGGYKTYALLQSFLLISSIFDINWLFFGLEKFKLTVTRNLVIKIISVICIFIFVKTADDIGIYIIIMACSTLISNILLFSFARRYINFVKIKVKNLKEHIKPILILFIPIISYSIYKIMDKIMIKNLANITEVGLYESAEKIISIPIGVITALGTVMLPRMSYLVQNKEKDKFMQYIKNSMEFVIFISLALAFGIMLIADDFVPLFFGAEFISASAIVKSLAITIIFVSVANVIRTQYLIPKERDKVYVISTILGALLNLIINIILIPRFGAIGAAIGTIFAEFVVMLYQVIKVREELEIKTYIMIFFKYLFIALGMYVLTYLVSNSIQNIVIKLIISICVGGLFYITISYLLYKNKRGKINEGA